MAIALKLVPAILLGFLLLRRKFYIISVTLVLVVVLCLLPGLVASKAMFTYYAYYLDSFLLKGIASVGGGDGETVSYNLQGLITYIAPYVGPQTWVRVVSSFVSLGLILLVELSTGKPPTGEKQVWAFSAYLIGAIMFSPMGETHHLVLILPAVTVVGLKLATNLNWVNNSIKIVAFAFSTTFLFLPKITGSKSMYFVPLALLLVLLYYSARDATFKQCNTNTSKSPNLIPGGRRDYN